jgi:hypothetical protein
VILYDDLAPGASMKENTMTNPFAKNPLGSTSPVATGANPFAGMNSLPERLPFLPTDCQAKVRMDRFRVVPSQPGSKVGLAVYMDVTVTEVYAGSIREGGKYTHRINGFEDQTNGYLAHANLWNALLALFAADGLDDATKDENGQPIDRTSIVELAEDGKADGREVGVKTESKGRGVKPKTVATFLPL